ncbi:hypothetical protein BC832DRAFT_540171 [Gaertneriomyces semiglobifer]|nr:hypothetical protein BC832DRAFT_540171 [Gaertneriomyces semiglobifer]
MDCNMQHQPHAWRCTANCPLLVVLLLAIEAQPLLHLDGTCRTFFKFRTTLLGLCEKANATISLPVTLPGLPVVARGGEKQETQPAPPGSGNGVGRFLSIVLELVWICTFQGQNNNIPGEDLTCCATDHFSDWTIPTKVSAAFPAHIYMQHLLTVIAATTDTRFLVFLVQKGVLNVRIRVRLFIAPSSANIDLESYQVSKRSEARRTLLSLKARLVRQFDIQHLESRILDSGRFHATPRPIDLHPSVNEESWKILGIRAETPSLPPALLNPHYTDNKGGWRAVERKVYIHPPYCSFRMDNGQQRWRVAELPVGIPPPSAPFV